MDRDEILDLRVIDLKEKLRQLGLSVIGRKETLQDRLLEHFGHQIETVESDGESDAGTNNSHNLNITDEVNKELMQIDKQRTLNHGRFFTLNDVRESLDYFDGTKPEIERWLENFEENAEAVNWDDLQKFLYAKQLIRGAAKIFIRGQSAINSWSKLKKSLLNEFGQKLSVIDIHKSLQNRRKRHEESCLEYLYTLIEISSGINMDEQSIIEYFIDGISDNRLNKLIFYDAKNIAELKDKIKSYEKIKSKEERHNRQKTTRQSPLQCSNCPHLYNHRTENCKKLNNLCFICGKKGHKAQECRSGNGDIKPIHNSRDQTNNNTRHQQNDNRNRQQNNRNQENTSTNNSQEQNTRRQPHEVRFGRVGSNFDIKVTINGHTYNAFFDTGSEISLMSYSLFNTLGITKLYTDKITIYGVGQGQLETLGHVMQKIIIDNQELDWQFHIVEDDDLGLKLLIGRDIVKIIDVYINELGLKFKLRNSEKLEDETLKDFLQVPEHCHPSFTAGLEFRVLCMDTPVEENLDLNHIEKHLQYKILNEIKHYKTEKVKSSNIKMKIIVTNNEPIFHRPRRLPIDDQKIVENQIEQWLKEGIIQPSQSEYSAPIVLVKKKNGSKRLCCDYRKINKQIVRDNFPMILIDDVLTKLQNAKTFTTLDLKNGFFHVPLEDDSIKYTSFVTHLGQYEFLKAPFGLTNSPAAFCRYITAIFNNLILDGTVIIYMDDIVIPAQNEEENLQKLLKVLKISSEHGLQINWQKCQFIKNEIQFLGYVIKDGSIKPSPEKIKAVSKYPYPKDIKTLQQFLGLTSYFRRFIPHYATIARPLTDLLSKHSNFEFGNDQNIAFLQLKDALTIEPILNIYNPYAETEVHTDASIHGYGAALMQKNSVDNLFHPVEYMSRKTNTCEEKYHSYDLEVLAIVAALKKWRTYLLGIHFKIVTDCIAFTQTVRKQDVPNRISRWVIFLEDFDYEIEHRKGNKLKHVDALSRVYCYMLSRSLKHRIELAQENDTWIKELKELISKGKHPEFFIKNNLLFKDYEKELLVIPRAMEEEIIEMAHRQGHFSAKRTMDSIESKFYIPELTTKASRIVKNCVQCIIAEAKAGKKEGLLCPIEKSNQPLDTFHIDHVGPLENTRKLYNHILTIVDAFSKFTWLYPVKSTGTQEVINILEKNAAIFGQPARIVTDRGVAFTSNMFKEYCGKNNITHILTTTGVPRSNGQVERIHKVVISLLTKLCSENKENWYKHLNNIQQAINNTPPRSTKISPFKIMTGIEMRIAGLADIKKIIEDEIYIELQNERENIRSIAKNNIAKIQLENKRNFNKKRTTGRDYQVGDVVAIKRTQFGSGLKIKPKFLGPYKITKKKRNGRYEVEKLEEFEGPIKTTTITEHLKEWKTAFGSNTASGRPNVGTMDAD